ncbi:MAG: hypothetical protein DDT36_01698 [Firmicutes bacterium]|nr:hypothetical protein [Bacillota bacterium]
MYEPTLIEMISKAVLAFIFVSITIEFGVRWHRSGRNHWYIFASGLACAPVPFVWAELGLMRTVQPVMYFEGIVSFFIIGCLHALVVGFLAKRDEKYFKTDTKDPRK